jgi:hypothetical protein
MLETVRRPQSRPQQGSRGVAADEARTVDDLLKALTLFEPARQGGRDLDAIFAWAMDGALPRLGNCSEGSKMGQRITLASGGTVLRYTTSFGDLAAALCGSDWSERLPAPNDVSQAVILDICRGAIRNRIAATGAVLMKGDRSL